MKNKTIGSPPPYVDFKLSLPQMQGMIHASALMAIHNQFTASNWWNIVHALAFTRKATTEDVFNLEGDASKQDVLDWIDEALVKSKRAYELTEAIEQSRALLLKKDENAPEHNPS